MRTIHIALLSAMPEEVGVALDHLEKVSCSEYGDLKIYSGKWRPNDNNTDSVNISLAWSGWGKVSAARAATRLIAHSSNNIPIDLILFTGVAGSVDSRFHQWDVIVAEELIQHDMNATPLFERFYIPALTKDRLRPSKKWLDFVFSSLKNAKRNGYLNEFGLIKKGLIGTGDCFISDKNDIDKLKDSIPDLKAVEMEGASVAQVALQEGIPWIIVRVISDEADESAHQSFNKFLEIYKQYAWNILKVILTQYKKIP